MIRIDPSRTGDIRRAYHAEIRRRFNDLALAIRDYIANQDAFNLNQSPAKFDIPLIRNAYEFATTDDKLKAFQVWLKTQITAKVLGSEQPETPWLSKYTESAYKRGITRAWLDTAKDRGADITKPSGFLEGSQAQFVRQTFSHPERTSKIKMAATRDFAELKGITDSMSAKMSTIFADGMANGRGAGPVARELVAQTGIDRKRADRLARTEIIHYHSEGQLDGFEDLGVEEVGIMAEVLTADDEKVCPICSGKTGKSYTIAQARGIIPFHPNCRCCWIPSTSRSRNKGKKPLKGLKTPSGRAKQESAKGKKVMAPAPTLWGLQPTGVMRWMGSQGWSLQEAEKVLTEKGISFSPNTLKTQLRWGKVGHELKPAALTVDQAAELNAIRFGRIPPSKIEPLVEIKLRTIPPKPTAESKPAWISFSGTPDPFTEKVWSTLNVIPGHDAPTLDHDVYRATGKLVYEEMNKDPLLVEFRSNLETARANKEKALTAWQDANLARSKMNADRLNNPTDSQLQIKYAQLKNDVDRMNAQIDEAAIRVNHLEQQQQRQRNEAALRTLKRVRDFGGGPLNYSINSDDRITKVLDKATDKLPADWVKAIKERKLSAVKVDRGYFDSGPGIVALSGSEEGDLLGVAVHELTHAAEALYRDRMGYIGRKFRESRIEPGEKLEQIAGHEVGEVGWKDKFREHYIGKDYGAGAAHTEIMSMGVEGIFEQRRSTYSDEDLTHFVLGMLAGF